MNKLWTESAWEDYLYWQQQDKKTLKRKKRMHKLKSTGCAVAYVLALCACQSPPVAVQCPEIPPMTLEKREPNLTERLLTILSLSQPTETQQSGS